MQYVKSFYLKIDYISGYLRLCNCKLVHLRQQNLKLFESFFVFYIYTFELQI